MKKLKSFWFAALAAALCGASFSSCSDDDNDGPSAVPSGPSASYSGKLVSAVGANRFMYDEKGRCCGLTTTYGDGQSVIDYGKSLLTTAYGTEYKLKFNGKGYIVSLSGSWDYSEEGDHYSGNGSMSFTYDGEGHLTGYTSKSSESGVEDGDRYSYSESGRCTITWENGNMVKMVKSITGSDGEKYGSSSSFVYGTMPNAFRQYSYTQAAHGLDFELDLYAIAGLFGISSAMLPDSYEYEDIFDGEKWSQSNNCTFVLNEDGTIKKEDSHVYDYIEVGTVTSPRSSAGRSGINAADAAKKTRAIFMPMRGKSVR